MTGDLSTAMADMVRTEATIDKWVMKLVTLQNMRPNAQSLETKGDWSGAPDDHVY